MAEGNPTNYESYGKRTDEKGGYNKQGLYAFPRGFHHRSNGNGALYETKDNIDLTKGTVCMWIKNDWKTAIHSGRCLLNIYQGNNGYLNKYLSLVVYKQKGTVLEIKSKNGTNQEFAVDSGKENKRWYANKKWTHIAFSYNNETGQVSIYINGAAAGEAFINPWEESNATYIRLGARSFLDVIGSFIGYIDEVRIYKEPLTLKQIKQVYQLFIEVRD